MRARGTRGTLVVIAATACVLVYGACSTARLGPIDGSASEPAPDAEADPEVDPDADPVDGGRGIVDARADAPRADAGSDAQASVWPCRPSVDAGGALDREWATGPLPPASPPAGTYALEAKTVCDRTTLLEWERAVGSDPRTWDDAKAYCDSLLLDGASDWRLPTRIELLSIVDFGRKEPSIDPVAFPDTPSDAFWSSTLMFNVFNDPNAYLVVFDRGHAAPFTKAEPLFVRCVRGGR